MDSLQASAKELLINELNNLRREVGKPSLGELVRLGENKYSKSTIDDHLSGRRSTVPNWRLTAAYIKACLKFAEDTGLNVRRLGSMDEWRTRWLAATRGDRNAVSPIRESVREATYRTGDAQQDDVEFIDPVVGSFSSTWASTAFGQAAVKTLEIDIPKVDAEIPAGTGLLVVWRGPNAGARYAVASDLVTIGRAPDSDIFLDDATVSRRHAIIRRSGDSFTVLDVGSVNGTYVQHNRVLEETALLSRDQLHVGVYRMVFMQGSR